MFDRGKQPEYEMDLENRFVAPEVTENDRDNELSLRPHTLEEYIGQEQVKENLSVFMQAARLRGEPLDHVLLYGPPGLGKTTLSQIIAAEMGVNIRITSGPAIEKPGDLAALLTNLNENDILFIDEIHRLNRSVEEVLYPAMEDYALDIIIGKGPSARSIRIDLPRFTLVGATTRAGQLSAPLRDRFGVVFRLELYTPEELSQIVTRSAGILGIPCEAEGAMELARRSRGTPRIANRFLKRVRDFAQVQGSGAITPEIAAEALAGLPNAAISKVAAGTNGTAPTENDTSITDPTIVDVQTVEYPAPDTVRFNFTFGYMDAAGKSIAEFGLLTTDGRLFARKVRQPIEKTEYMTIKGSWEISGAGMAKTPTEAPKYPITLTIDNYKTGDVEDKGKWPIISLYGVGDADNVADYKIYLFRRTKGRYKFASGPTGSTRKISKTWRHPKHGVSIGQADFALEFGNESLDKAITEFGIEKFKESTLIYNNSRASFGHIVGWMFWYDSGLETTRLCLGLTYKIEKADFDKPDSPNPDYKNFMIKNIGFAAFKNGIQVSEIKEFKVVCSASYGKLEYAVLTD